MVKDPLADQQLLHAITRTLKRIVPHIGPDSSYILSLPWLAIILVQSAVESVFLPAVELLGIALDHLYASSYVPTGSCFPALIKARETALAATDACQALDAESGVPRLSSGLAWGIAGLCAKGLLTKDSQEATERLFRRFIASMLPPNARSLPPEALPFFIPLLLCGSGTLEDQLAEYGLASTGGLLAKLSLSLYEPQMLAMAMLSSLVQETHHLAADKHARVLALILEIGVEQPACVVAQYVSGFACAEWTDV
jgi:hypothetical protein